MKRREAIAALALLAGTARLRASPTWRGAGLAWGPGGCWVAEPGQALQRLPAEAAAGPPPRALAGDVWQLANPSRVQRWHRERPGQWRPAWQLELPAPVHALAVGEGGAFGLAAHGEQASLFDGAGSVVRVFEGRDLAGTRRGPAQALFALPQRRSFVAAWPALGELWEIALDPAAPPIFDGLVHDYRMAEGIARRGFLGARRSPLGLPLPTLRFADARVPWVAGTLGDTVAVIHLDVRRRIAALPLPGARLEAALLRRAYRPADGPGRGDTGGDAGGDAGRNAGGNAGGGAGPWQWWVPVGDELQVVDTARWQLLERRPMPGTVLALQDVGESVWALVATGGATAGAADLRALHGADGWRRIALPAGRPRALAGDRAGDRALVAVDGPAALLMLDGDGRMLERWALPDGAAVDGVAWMG